MAKTVTKVWVDTDNCTSCEACVASAPDVFEMKGDVAAVKAEAKDAAFLQAHSDEIIAAAGDCPCEAIKFEAK
ncbi:MAG TPA: ferredoxin [Phycisphaerae bacterium]|nr:ferredoxin [Phycisphaerae bacterium]HOW72055.1 ferredoxin [Phycisphaerae bacterium]HRY70711.1 ferredoxin [Phycisphaerae bacterium]HSA28745.1 ferredoxin [Phycisphaerae bacterium]